MPDNQSTHEDTTESRERAQRLIDLTGGIGRPLATAIRSQANGHEVDILSALAETRKLMSNIAAQLIPATEQSSPLTYDPLALMDAYWQRIEQKKDAATTGIASLDKALSGGFEEHRLVVLLGAPGSGKTTFINQIANHAADSGRPVLYVTSEDMPMTLLAKTIARRGGIDYTAVQKGWPTHRVQINTAFAQYKQQKSARLLRYLDATSGVSLDTIAEQAEEHFNAHLTESSGAPIIVVDYLQRLARAEHLGTDLRSSITAYTENLRKIALDLHCTVIVLSAMNRASKYQTGDSTISSAKESGDIDYTADVIMAIGAQEGTLETAPGIRRWGLRIDKNRQGSITYDGTHIELDWYAARQQFTEAMKDEDIRQDIDKVAGGKSTSGRGRR